MSQDYEYAEFLGLLKAEAAQAPNTQAQNRRRARARADLAREFVRIVDAGDTPDADTLRTIADMLRGLEAVNWEKRSVHNSPVAKALGLSGTWADDAPDPSRQAFEAAVIFAGPEAAGRRAATAAGPEGTPRFERKLDSTRRRAYEIRERRQKKGR